MSDFSDFIVYVDESGDHSLTSIDKGYPIFVLSFCVFRKADYAGPVTYGVRRLKFETFGHDMVILHEQDIRKKTGAFSRLGKEAREQFLNALTDIISATDFTLFAVVIDKRRLNERYIEPQNPYHLAMGFGLERIYRTLNPGGADGTVTHVICESRGRREDAELELEFRRIVDGANFFNTRLPFELVIADKKTNSEGMQLADLTARPIGLSVLRPGQPNRAFELLKTKLAKDGRGKIDGVGLKIFP